ncbi:MAG: Trigger factor [Calditrichaeota bacterium]|nr:Trigger factor [Calditrichota bacterium]
MNTGANGPVRPARRAPSRPELNNGISVNVQEPVQEGCVVRVGVELDADELRKHIDAAYDELRESENVPGFRRGKVPDSVLKQRFGRRARHQAAEGAIQETLPEALQRTELNPIAIDPVEDIEYGDGGGFSFTAVVEVPPEVDPEKWRGVRVRREIPEITAEDVDRHLAALRRDHAVVSEAGEDDVTELHDRLTVDVQTLDESGLPIIGSKEEDITFELGAEFFGTGTDGRLLGMKVGDSRRVDVELDTGEPDGESGTELSAWNVTLKKLEKVELPELDGDFAAQIDDTLSSMDALREKVSSQLHQFAQYQANQRAVQRLKQAVVRAYDFDLPPALYKQTVDDMVERQQEEGGGEYDKKMLRMVFQPVVRQELTWFFIRRGVIKTENIEATDEEIEQHVENYHNSHPETNLEELKLLFKSGERREQLADEIIMGKVMELMRQGVQWDEEKTDFMTLLQDQLPPVEDEHEHEH